MAATGSKMFTASLPSVFECPSMPRLRRVPPSWGDVAPIGGQATLNGRPSSVGLIRPADMLFLIWRTALTLRLTPRRTVRRRNE